jgi:hypothetical protein
MCCEELVCARCAGPVAEARCPACRAARAMLHHNSYSITPQLLAVVLLTIVALFLVAYHF